MTVMDAADYYARWQDALARYRRDETDDAADAEQAAHDALVDYVESHELNGSMFDPRSSR